MEQVKTAEKGEDPAAIKSAVDNLQLALMAFSKIYEQAAQAEAAGGDQSGPSGPKSDDGVIDAEFERKE